MTAKSTTIFSINFNKTKIGLTDAQIYFEKVTT